MHPAIAVAIIAGAGVTLYLGIDLAKKLYEEYAARQEYLAYVESYHEKGSYQDDDSDNENPFDDKMAWSRSDSHRLRRRRRFSPDDGAGWMLREDDMTDTQESINEQRKRLLRDQQRLWEAEMELQQREARLRSQSNIMMGVNPFADENADNSTPASEVEDSHETQSTQTIQSVPSTSSSVSTTVQPNQAPELQAPFVPSPHSSNLPSATPSESSWNNVDRPRSNSGGSAFSFDSLRTPSAPSSASSYGRLSDEEFI